MLQAHPLFQLQRAHQVLVPTMPSTFNGLPSKSTKSPWNALTAASVSGPKSLSTVPGSYGGNAKLLRICWRSLTAWPFDPFLTDCGVSLNQVCGPTIPSTCRGNENAQNSPVERSNW